MNTGATKIRRIACRLIAACSVLVLAMVGFPVNVQAAAVNRLQIATYLDQPVTSQGQTFYSRDFYLNRTGDRVVVAGSPDGTASFYVDDLLQVSITHPDGTTAATTVDDSNGCTADTVLTTPATNITRFLQYGVNKVHLTFSDSCGGNYGNSDIWVGGTVDFPPARDTLPSIDGGTRVAVIYTNPAFRNRNGTSPGIACTTSFGVTSFAETSYELTAKHCFDREQGDQSTNAYVGPSMPVDVRTIDSKYTFAQELSCLAGARACLLPRNNARPSADVVAFKPDSATVTSRVQTGSGMLPVLGESNLDALAAGTQICHFGNGSLSTFGKAEQCGSSRGYTTARNPGQGVPAGLGFISARGAGGDSGGPVYVYARNAAGRVIGVYALGVAIIASETSGTIFIPIRDVEVNLAVRLLTGPPIT